MNLFNIELAEEPKGHHIDRAQENRDFRKSLGMIVNDYLGRRISFLTYIERMYEVHRMYKRKGFNRQDLIREREKFFQRKATPLAS